MIAVSRAHPGDARDASLFDGDIRRAAHDQVTHGVVAVNQRGCGVLANDADIRPRIDSAALNPLHVLRQAKYAVTVRTARIGFCNELGHAMRVGLGEADGLEHASNECGECGDRDHNTTVTGSLSVH
jgi:hypothetical protein